MRQQTWCFSCVFKPVPAYLKAYSQQNDVFPLDVEVCSSPWPSVMSSTPLPEAQTGTKRKRELISALPSELDDINIRSSLTHPQEHDADIEGASGQVCNHAKEQQFLHLIWGYQSEECKTAGKRRPPEDVQLENVTDTQKDSSKDLTRGCIPADRMEEIPESMLHRDQTQQCSHENIQTNGRIRGESGVGSSAPLSTEDAHTQKSVKDQSVTALFLSLRSATDTHNTMKRKVVKSYKEPELLEQRLQWSPVKGEDKENRPSTALSPFKQHVWSSPAKRSSDFNRKVCRTPKKSIREAQENDEDSFGTLFTQDSEGFRVIAHRTKQARCPIRDQTNSCEAREYLSIPSVRLLEMQENSDRQPEMLFTQDSQGNVVIKH